VLADFLSGPDRHLGRDLEHRAVARECRHLRRAVKVAGAINDQAWRSAYSPVPGWLKRCITFVIQLTYPGAAIANDRFEAKV
jgi:hypothetical protein